MYALKWIKIWFTIMMLIPLVGLFNYVIDPLGFNKKILINNINIFKEDNTLFTIKYKMPLLRKGGWDNLMLGTSRIGVMDPHIVDTYLGGKTFNMSIPLSLMPSQLDSFLYAIKFNKIKNIIYGIDFITFDKNRKLNDDYIQYKDELQSFGKFRTYDIYFNLKTLKKSIDTILNNSSSDPKLYPFFSENGMRNFQNFEQQLSSGHFNIQTSINKHLQRYFRENDGFYVNYDFSSEYMQMFKKIVNYCHQNDINIYVYIPPMYVEHFYAIKEAGLKIKFETFKRELVKITDFIDFTGVNSITTNKNNYWDSSHLRTEHTKIVMARLIDNIHIEKHQNFGIMVTKNNIEEHLKKQDSQYREIDLK